ncbi:MAG: pseudoazurin [Paracoccaceae bacterium]
MFGKLLATAAAFTLLAGAAGAATYDVKMLNKGEAGAMVFEPAFVKAQPGDTINFIATDKGHNAETIKGMMPEGAEGFKGGMGKDISVTLDKEGVYGVKCLPHYALGMVALIQVGDPVNLDEAEDVKQRGKAAARFDDLFAQVAQ